MPRIKYPPTPTASTGPTAQDKQSDMEGAFVLPPAAMNRSPPTSPVLQRKRTLSGSAKLSTRDELPPPPSRARKIIQMKPKEDKEPPQAITSNPPAASKTTASPKRKQPSATSAAGRKIARKTAHSIIERRRRSKMNEEFGVLKDMIPACKGVEMHKLAILQAGIEYVRYLQGCIDTLQGDRGVKPTAQPYRRSHVPSIKPVYDDDDDESDEGEDEDMDELPEARDTPAASPRTSPQRYQPDSHSEYRRGSMASTATNTTSAQASPAIRPNTSSSSLASQRRLPPLTAKPYSTSPPPLSAKTPLATGVSPAFNAMYFYSDSHKTNLHHTQNSPNILPLPKAAMPMNATDSADERAGQDVHAEATATAALMMLTNDRRVSGGGEGSRRSGMSVKDLLSH